MSGVAEPTTYTGRTMVDAADLYKQYASVVALNQVNLSVREGEVFGIIGPDGAGKTTLMRIAASLLRADSGTIRVAGHEVVHEQSWVRSHVGYMPQRFSLYMDLSVEENLNFFGRLFRVPANIHRERKQRLYRFSRLERYRDRKAGALSGGMKQKLALSCVLMHDPQLLILDEPTFGVDPVSRQEFWELIAQLNREGATILVSTAYMDEAELCQRVGLMHQGNILAVGTPAQLKHSYPGALYRVVSTQPQQDYRRLRSSGFPGEIQLFGDGFHVTDPDQRGEDAIGRLLQQAGVTSTGIYRVDPSLEDLFLREAAREGGI